MKRIFGVIGLGRFGFFVAKTLAELGAEVIAIDKDEQRVRQIAELVTYTYVADALDERALEEAGIFNADTVVVSIGQNVEASIFVVVILKERGVREIVAKAVNQIHGKVLEKLGVKRVVYPEMETAVKLAHSLLIQGVVEEIPFAPGYSIFELQAPESFYGKTLKELDLRRRYGITVIAIKKRDGRVKVNPSGEDRIEEGDTLLVLGNEEALMRLGG
ncbi:MAG: TrkA family potassium uptake protein, partial [Aquificae bacterium]|nr:TrkA family potassium uptake protein [Aquificota bacterium]